MNRVEMMVDKTKTRKKLAVKMGEIISAIQEISVQTRQVHITNILD